MRRSRMRRLVAVALSTGLLTVGVSGTAMAERQYRSSNQNASCIGELAGGSGGAKSNPRSASTFVHSQQDVAEEAGQPYGRFVVAPLARQSCD